MSLDRNVMITISRMAILGSCMFLVSLVWAQTPTMDRLAELETAVEMAKVNYATNPSPANLAVLDLAQSTYSEYFHSLTFVQSDGSTRAQIGEAEPNSTAATSSGPLTPGTDSGTGSITPATDRDFWEVAGVSAGDLAFVVLDTAISGSGTDTEMSVFQNDGTTLIEFDDDSGDGLASAVAAVVPVAGSIFIEINEFGDNGTITPYELFQVIVSPGSGVAEIEPNDTTATATPITSMLMTGDIAGGTDFFSFPANAGERIVVVVDNDPDVDTIRSDLELNIFSTNGTTSLAAEAPFTVTTQNAAIGTANSTGTHFLRLVDGLGGSGDTNYRFIVIVGGNPVPVELQSFSIQ